MAKVIFGNHSSVIVPLKDRDSIRKFYCDVLGGEIMKADPERDFVRLGKDFFIGFLYGDVPDESEFLRTARSIWLEIKSDNVEEMTRKILDFGVRKLDIPDPHFYFQTPGGQVLRLVGIDEDMSFYEGTGEGPDVEKVKEAVGGMKKHPDFSYVLRVKASPKEVMKKISQVNLWWAKNFKGKAAKLNDEFSVYFGDTYVNFRISEVIPDKKIVWLVTDCNLHWIKDKKEWKDTEVIWTLTEKGGKTQIDFVHKGVTPDSECYESCKPGWTHHLKDSLLKLIDAGEGFPE